MDLESVPLPYHSSWQSLAKIRNQLDWLCFFLCVKLSGVLKTSQSEKE